MPKTKHRPPHIYKDNTYYFITGRTYKSIGYLDTPQKKGIAIKALREAIRKFHYSLQAWVILDNHYHIVIKTNKGKNLPLFIQKVHGKTSRGINKINNKQAKIWYQYWDKCIRNKIDFWKHVNYIHQNPVKHRYAKNIKDYQFSSLHQYIKKFGKEFIIDSFRQYPIIDFTTEDAD